MHRQGSRPRPLCDKIAYATKQEAKDALQTAQVVHDPNGRRQEQRFYRCDRCGCWHLTSMSRAEYAGR